LDLGNCGEDGHGFIGSGVGRFQPRCGERKEKTAGGALRCVLMRMDGRLTDRPLMRMDGPVKSGQGRPVSLEKDQTRTVD
jgi:hypothetical protein